jgi:Ser-tRNA(Ala) deacylase AlaX
VSVYLCHLEPELFDFEAEVLESRPGEVLLSRSALHPLGGGQVSDVAVVEHRHGTAGITGCGPRAISTGTSSTTTRWSWPDWSRCTSTGSAAPGSRSCTPIRSLSVAPPPTPDGQLRIIEIVGVDRQACGGTHLANTGQSLPVRITKVESKGRRNRRVRLVLQDS